MRFLLVILIGTLACGSGPAITHPCDSDASCQAGLSCVSVNFKTLCLVEVTDNFKPNGDPICPFGLGGFQTMSGILGDPSPPEHHAVCSLLCRSNGDCDWDTKCMLKTTGYTEDGVEHGVCIPF